MIIDAAAEKQASDIVLLDLRKITLIADYFVVCSGQTLRQIKSITEGVLESIRDRGVRPLAVEGESDSGWVLVDLGSVIVHIFSPELRSYYALEELWRDAPVVVHMQ
jgi:ribosome-associated protein